MNNKEIYIPRPPTLPTNHLNLYPNKRYEKLKSIQDAERNFFENMTSQKKKRWIIIKKDIHNSDYFNLQLKEKILKAYSGIYKNV
jgi:hypothetical protein